MPVRDTRQTLLRYQTALEAGISRHELRSHEFTRVHHNLYLSATESPRDPDVRTRIAAHIAGGQAHVGGWAAARILERRALASATGGDSLRLFDGIAPWPGSNGELEPVLLCMNRDAKIRTPPGIRPLRSDLEPEDLVNLEGLSMTSPLRTAFDLARTQAPWHAVASVDRLAHLGIIDLTEFNDYVRVLARRKGAPAALKIARVADRRAESPPESVTRMIWSEARLPRPLVNAEIHAPSGAFVARVDLLDPASRLIVEYDGAHHASASQRSRDSAREQALEELGYIVVKVTAADLASPESRRALRSRLVRAYRQALQLNRHA